jgi:surface protein
MNGLFSNTPFNQPIGSWNVGNVKFMDSMFEGANAFNQPLSCWNVGNVQNMSKMFLCGFNQNIGSWNVGNVTNMTNMINANVSTANYDSLLIGWSTIGPNETPLKPNVVFSTASARYCNGASARTSIINTFGWTISDGGLNCTNIGIAGPNCESLDTEEFNTSSLKLFPNPVLNVLNVKVDSNLINLPYTIIDGLGRVILKGRLNDIETSINLEQLSKGIYYLKVSDNIANKFVKE